MSVDFSNGVPINSIMDYMGIPVGYKGEFNALPIRAYHKIWDDWFRDENLQDPLNIYTGDDTMYLSDNDMDYLSEYYIWPRKAARYHDYFSSCLPAPQKGPDVSVPNLGGFAPVVTRSINGAEGLQYVDNGKDPLTESGAIYSNVGLKLSDSTIDFGNPNMVAVGNYLKYTTTPGDDSIEPFPTNLWVNLNQSTQVTMPSINDLRMAFQIQRLYERDAIGGSRYVEILRSHFGVTSPDARLQRSEYLGGNRIALNVSQVVNSSESASYKLGNLGAMSHTVDMHEDFVKSFTEHGFVIGVCVVRYANTYAQGLERFWSRSDRFSYYWPALSRIGNQAILEKEIYAVSETPDAVFGYQEAWADLRYKPNRVSAEMRPGVSNSLASWNLADYYTTDPVLSDEWIQTDKGIVDRTLAVTSSLANQVFADIYVKNYCTRVLPMYSVPGLIDHF